MDDGLMVEDRGGGRCGRKVMDDVYALSLTYSIMFILKYSWKIHKKCSNPLYWCKAGRLGWLLDSTPHSPPSVFPLLLWPHLGVLFSHSFNVHIQKGNALSPWQYPKTTETISWFFKTVSPFNKPKSLSILNLFSTGKLLGEQLDYFYWHLERSVEVSLYYSIPNKEFLKLHKMTK